jgi:hypothetical protein
MIFLLIVIPASQKIPENGHSNQCRRYQYVSNTFGVGHKILKRIKNVAHNQNFF